MSSDAVNLFFSYSHKDEDLRDELTKHLSALKRRGFITDWHERKILPGDEWSSKVQDNLKSAHIILLLISSDFIASDYCFDIEIKQAMERHSTGKARVIPVILRSCDWSDCHFGKLKALPKDGKAVTSWINRDEAFTDIAKGLKKVAKDVRQGKVTQQADCGQSESNDHDPHISQPHTVDIKRSVKPANTERLHTAGLTVKTGARASAAESQPSTFQQSRRGTDNPSVLLATFIGISILAGFTSWAMVNYVFNPESPKKIEGIQLESLEMPHIATSIPTDYTITLDLNEGNQQTAEGEINQVRS